MLSIYPGALITVIHVLSWGLNASFWKAQLDISSVRERVVNEYFKRLGVLIMHKPSRFDGSGKTIYWDWLLQQSR